MGLFTKHRERTQAEIAHPTTSAVPLASQAPKASGFAVIDVETTGLRSLDRIVEVAVVCTDPRGQVVDEWATLINPDGPVGATRIHGITNADVRRAPRFRDIAGEVNARLAGRALVAHNAKFDLSFIRTEYARSGWQFPDAPHLCTLVASWIYLPHLSRRRLPDCCWASGVELTDAHSALGDARATAGLLASYLNPDTGRPPLPEHVNLPVFATRTAWPVIPRSPSATAALRRAAQSAPTPAQPGALAMLLENLPLSSMVEEGAPPDTTAYLELLAEVLEDGVLTESEANSLADLATHYGLVRDQIHVAHRGFLLALAHKAVEDGKITRGERSELLGVAAALGFADSIVKVVLDEARAAFSEQRAAATKPLPEHWPYGAPLHIGQSVAFTGCDDVERARLEGQARAAGLRVIGAVSRKTAVLVTDRDDYSTTKAITAREYGVRVVTPAVFAQLVTHIQPAVGPAASPPSQTIHRQRQDSVSGSSAKPSVTSALPSEDPAAIRTWAREQGIELTSRGRLPLHVVDAYRAAHAETS